MLNIKTAVKRLQFWESKCKSMIITKNSKESIINNPLLVDKRKTTHMTAAFLEKVNLWKFMKVWLQLMIPPNRST